MNIDAYEFGKGEHPDKAFGILYPVEMEENYPDRGMGLCVCSINHPENHNYGEVDIFADECTPVFCMWFYREESIDAAIRKLIEIKTEIINQHLRQTGESQ